MLKSQIYKRRTQNHFYKIYPKDVLLDSFEKIEIRLNLVKSVSQYFFDYEWTKSNLILSPGLSCPTLYKSAIITLAILGYPPVV